MKQNIINIALASVLAIGIGACSPSLTSVQHIEKGKSYLAENKNNEAIIELKNAIKKDAKNLDARLILGKTYLSQGDYKNAKKELERSIKLGATSEYTTPNLAEIYYKLNDFDNVYNLVASAELLHDEQYVTVLTYAGMAAIYEKKFDKAQGYFDRAIQISEDFLYSKISRGYMARTEEEISSAIESVEILMASNPEIVDLILLKGYLLQSTKQYQTAAETFTEYSVKRPKESSILFFIAQNYIRANQLERAEPIVDAILKIANSHPLANQLKAQILFDNKNYALAKQHANTALQQQPDLALSHIIAGLSAYYVKEYESTYQHLSKVSKRLPKQSLVNRIFIEVQLLLGYEVEALDSIQQLMDSNNIDFNSLLTLSNELIKSGNNIAAKALIDKAGVLADKDPSNLLRQGFLRLRLDDVELGIAALEESLALDPSSDTAEGGLVIGYLQNKQYDSVLKIAKKWQENSDKKVSGLLLQATIEAEQQLYGEAKVTLKDVFTIEPNNIAAHLNMAIIEHKSGNYSVAFESYKQVLTLKPNHEKAIFLITKLTIDSPSLLPEVKRSLQELLALNNNMSIKLGLANVFRTEGNLGKALELYVELMATGSLDGIEIMVGDLYSLTNKLDRAIDTYKNYYEKNKTNLMAGKRLIVAYEQAKEYALAASLIGAMRNYHRNLDGLVLLNGYFKSMAKQDVSSTDLTIIKGSRQLNNHWLANQMHGHIAYNEKNYDQAVNEFESGYQKNPTQLTLTTLFKALSLNGQNDKVIELSLDYLKKNEDSRLAKIYLANAYLNTAQNDKALALYRELVDKFTGNAILLNNLAYLEMQQGNSLAAIKYARKALTLSPNSITVIDTYAQALASNKEYNQSLDAYDTALVLADESESLDIIFAKAKLLLTMGNKKVARQLLLSMTAPSNSAMQIKIDKLLSETR
ncbi:MAG: PEP-CTERM system TPR-repeat protein PrsT [Colwellia sp.]|jgi:putative PEP-CTERM system TPR-repeat lipoprotein|nr:MAG: PEP-CTERM system TPR-repeat protein PrsT [Colwellia sp.]